MYIPPHTQLESYASQTYVTGSGTECVPPTKEECFENIIHYACELLKSRWWESERWDRSRLKLWCERYNKLSNKE
jgi:hypothetical protein